MLAQFLVEALELEPYTFYLDGAMMEKPRYNGLSAVPAIRNAPASPAYDIFNQ